MGLAFSFISHMRIFLVIENPLNTQVGMTIRPPVFGIGTPRKYFFSEPLDFGAASLASGILGCVYSCPLCPATSPDSPRGKPSSPLRPGPTAQHLAWPRPPAPRIIGVDTWQEVSPYKTGEAKGQQNVPQPKGSTGAGEAGP